MFVGFSRPEKAPGVAKVKKEKKVQHKKNAGGRNKAFWW